MSSVATSDVEDRQYQMEIPNPIMLFRERTLFREKILKAVPPGNISLNKRIGLHIEYFADEYAKADVLALQYQKRYVHASVSIYLLSALAVLAVAAQHLFSLHHLVVALEILAMVLILGILYLENRLRWQGRWLDYRFLAERIRYGLYLAFLLQGSDPNETKSPWNHRAETTWCFRYFLKFWDKRPVSAPLQERDVTVIKSLIDRTWLEDQRLYHFGKKTTMKKKDQILSIFSKLFFRMTLLAAFLHLSPAILHLLHLNIHWPAEQAINPTLTFLAITFPTLASSFTGLRAHFDYNKTADRSRMMERSLEILQKELAKTKDLQDIIKIVIEAESLMIQENLEWYIDTILHRPAP
jgi:hypothetical protein